ncbi:MAG: ribosome silencing factor [Bdellovibrionota bacterium]
MMETKELAELCARKCLEKKAENVVILDLENRSSVADYFVVCSGFSDRQVAAVADHVSGELRQQGIKASSEEGLAEGRWALIDFGSVIVHVFQDQLRDYYNLEALWLDAPRIRAMEDGTFTRQAGVKPRSGYIAPGNSGTTNF